MPVRADLMRIALSFPDAKLQKLWGEDVVKVRGKIFAYLGREDASTENHGGFGVKLPVSGVGTIKDGSGEAMGHGMGKNGWVMVKPTVASKMSEADASRWLKESYAAVAPKTLAIQLLGDQAAPKKAELARKAPTVASAAKKKTTS